jgi:hypothetical protein
MRRQLTAITPLRHIVAQQQDRAALIVKCSRSVSKVIDLR